MKRALFAVVALAIGLTFGLATLARADEKPAAATAEKKEGKKADKAEQFPKKDGKKTEKK
jgi:hypothetical protein